MAKNALFDPKRKQRVRDALENGDLGQLFRKKNEPERIPSDPSEASKEKIFGKVPGTGSGLLMLCVNPPRFEIGNKTYSANELLLLAIIYNDLQTATAAIEGGADVNHSFDRFPSPPPGSVNEIPDIPMFLKESVLQFAHSLGRLEIEFLLIAKGAVE